MAIPQQTQLSINSAKVRTSIALRYGHKRAAQYVQVVPGCLYINRFYDIANLSSAIQLPWDVSINILVMVLPLSQHEAITVYD
jgi:hypothetical protein